MTRAFTRITYTDAVKSAQSRLGTRALNTATEARVPANDTLTPQLIQFITERDSFFLATVASNGWPYVQHRGGPRGFLRVLDPSTLAFADFAGNKQYLTIGNLAENDRVSLFLMDWAQARRLKIWGRATVDEDADFAASLMPADYQATAERAIRIRIEAWDLNCRQHIQRRFSQGELAPLIQAYETRIVALEARLRDAGLALP